MNRKARKKKQHIRPLGKITEDLEPLLYEMVDKHKLQAHEILGIIYLWIKVHYPDAIEIYENGESPEFYGPRKK